MTSEIFNYLSQQPLWFRISIPDLAWFLRASEGEIRSAISDLRLISPPLPAIPKFEQEKLGNLYFFHTVIPYFVYRDEAIIIAEVLGRTKIRSGQEFEKRMISVRSQYAGIEEARKAKAWNG